MGDSLVEKMGKAIFLVKNEKRGHSDINQWCYDVFVHEYAGDEFRDYAKAALTALSTAELDEKALEAADDAINYNAGDQVDRMRLEIAIKAYLQHLARPYEGQ